MGKLHSIQALRAIAAWLVVFHHYMQVFWNFRAENWLSQLLSTHGSIGVDLFFVISGFVIYLSTPEHTGPGIFLLKRLARIVPAYWVFTLLVAASLLYLPTTILFTQFDTVFLVQSLFFVPAQNPSGIGPYPLLTVGWTLNYEMLFYLVFGFSLFLPGRTRFIFICFILATTQILSRKAGLFYGDPILYEFLLGAIIAILYKRGMIIKMNHMLAFILAGAGISFIYVQAGVGHDPVKFGIPCALIVIAAINFEKYFRVRCIEVLGDWSYSTYLCHVLILCYMRQLQLAVQGWDAFILLSSCVLILLVSFLSFKFVESPAILFLKTFRTK